MSELIDREATVKQICKIGEMVGGHDRDVVISIALFVQDDKTAFPTITIPVAELDTTEDSGEWIDRSDGGRIIYPFWERYECSKCGAKSENTNFCPNCGSDNRPKIHGCCFVDETCKNNPCKDCGLREGEKNESDHL